MRIMICDDEKKELEHMEKIVSQFKKKHPELAVDTCCFLNPFDFLEEMERSGPPDIALLDICMPGILGTEIARELQSKNEDSTDIIFLTTSNDFAVEAFSLHVKDYLKKPYSDERLLDTLERVVDKRQKRLFVPIQCGKEMYRVDIYTVMYAEIRNGGVEIHLKTGNTLKTRMTLANLMTLFENTSGFTTVGASYIVNLRCVDSILQSTLKMSNGEIIPIPRRFRSELKKIYFDFYKEEAIKSDPYII